MTETRIIFMADGHIEGFADTTTPDHGVVTLPGSLHWDRMPLLVDTPNWGHEPIGTITKLEYRGDKLWCEAILNRDQRRMPEVEYRFGVSFMLEEYDFITVGDGEQVHVKRGELIEIHVLPEIAVDSGENTP